MNCHTAVITGAGGGIGYAVVETLLAQGTRVIAIDTDGRKLERISGLHPDADLHTRQLDVADPHSVSTAINDIEQHLGPITELVNTAGILRAGPILDLTAQDWDRTMAVNAGGVFHVSRAVARYMVTRGSGSIVTVASNAAHTPRFGMGAYSASKAAAEMVTKTLGLELARQGIRCNVVAPGSTQTPMLTALWDDPDQASRASIGGFSPQFRIGIPLGKIADPSDIAHAVTFLLGPHASHITMHRLTVDGGATLGL